MDAHARLIAGGAIARTLVGAWRAEPPVPAITVDELQAIEPLLLQAGLGGLAWWTTHRDAALSGAPSGVVLGDAYRRHVLHARAHDLRLDGLLGRIADAGLDPILVKGASIAGRYPERGLRTFGDVDLLIEPEHRTALEAVLAARPTDASWIDVDLHHAFARADGVAVADLRARSRRATIAGHDVAVLGPEDELRTACLHYLRGGGWAIRSLVDIALLLETAPGDLDWERVLHGPRAAGWVRAAAGLAAIHLGARLEATPLADAPAAVPEWVVAHTRGGFPVRPGDRNQPPPWRMTADPRAISRQLRDRWADPLEVTLHLRRPIPRRSAAPLQAFDLAQRVAAVALPLRGTRSPRRQP